MDPAPPTPDLCCGPQCMASCKAVHGTHIPPTCSHRTVVSRRGVRLIGSLNNGVIDLHCLLSSLVQSLGAPRFHSSPLHGCWLWIKQQYSDQSTSIFIRPQPSKGRFDTHFIGRTTNCLCKQIHRNHCLISGKEPDPCSFCNQI